MGAAIFARIPIPRTPFAVVGSCYCAGMSAVGDGRQDWGAHVRPLQNRATTVSDSAVL